MGKVQTSLEISYGIHGLAFLNPILWSLQKQLTNPSCYLDQELKT